MERLSNEHPKENIPLLLRLEHRLRIWLFSREHKRYLTKSVKSDMLYTGGYLGYRVWPVPMEWRYWVWCREGKHLAKREAMGNE